MFMRSSKNWCIFTDLYFRCSKMTFRILLNPISHQNNLTDFQSKIILCRYVKYFENRHFFVYFIHLPKLHRIKNHNIEAWRQEVGGSSPWHAPLICWNCGNYKYQSVSFVRKKYEEISMVCEARQPAPVR